MSGIFTFFDNIEKLDPLEIMREVLDDSEVKAFIIELNTVEQLFDEGVDSEGRKLSDIRQPYQPSTIAKKRRQGLPTDRVTLFETGKFYLGWIVEILRNGDIEITAPTDIAPNYDLAQDYGENIPGLNEESVIKLSEFITPRYLDVLESQIFRNV